MDGFAFKDKSMTPFGAIVSIQPTGAIFSPDGRFVAYRADGDPRFL